MKFICVAATTLFLSCGSIMCLAGERVCPETIHNAYEHAQCREKDLSKHYPGLFSRADLRLIVNLTNGGEKVYTDDERKNLWYTFVAYYPEIGYGLIWAQFYEDGTNYLVNMRTGKDTDIVGDPILSPDKKRIAVSNVDLEAQYTPNVLSVYELRPDGLAVEFIEKPAEWGPWNLRWVTNQEISFIKYSFDSESPYKVREIPKTLKYVKTNKNGTGKWIIK